MTISSQQKYADVSNYITKGVFTINHKKEHNQLKVVHKQKSPPLCLGEGYGLFTRTIY